MQLEAELGLPPFSKGEDGFWEEVDSHGAWCLFRLFPCLLIEVLQVSSVVLEDPQTL